MPFRLPAAENSFSQRFFIMIAFFIEFFVEIILPGVVAVVLLAAIVLICGKMLGLTQDSPNNTTDQQTVREDRADSADLVQAVDDKTLLKIETKILKEMLQTRRTRLNGLVKSD